jgi:hypothetical protein
MDMQLYSERMDLNYLRTLNAGSGNRPTRDTITLPDRLYLKTRFWFDELEVKDFFASHVNGNLIYQPGRLSINRVEFRSMDGRVESEGILEQRQDMNFLVKSSSRIASVNIGKAFASFQNFGQEFILDRHLQGSLSGEVNFSAELSTRMKIRKESVLADCDIVIRDGELTGFEPMMTLSKYIEVEELRNVHFSTLTNEIFIRNQEVLIPRMDIHSSAFDLTASGLHGFTGDFSYKVKLSLSEILAGKSRKPEKNDSEFGIIEDDGLGRMFIYLIIEGSKDGTTVRYDRRGAVENIRDQMTEEKTELKKILNEEFGFFKKDSATFEEKTGGDTPEFIIEWDENMDTVSQDGKDENNKSGEERFIIEWDEEKETGPDSLPEKKNRRRRKIN